MADVWYSLLVWFFLFFFVFYVSQYPHDGAQGTLAISAGDRIELLQCPEAEWWFGRRLADDATGYFPAAFVAIAPRPSP